MSNPVGNIIRAATRRDGESLNILTFPTHERYETGLCMTGHKFWAMRGSGIKDWNQTYAPVPDNYGLLNPKRNLDQVPVELDFDLILAQSIGQFGPAIQLSKQMHLPLIRLEHTLPVPSWNRVQLEQLGKMKGHVNVFISEFSREKWEFGEQDRVIHHGVDTDTFSPSPDQTERKPHVLSVVNDWINRDWCCGFNIWKEATQGMPTKVVGDTPGLSQPAKDVNELVSFYREAQVFLNTSLVSPVPSVLLEAMACGCAVVSTATCMIPEIIKHEENGFISNDPKELTRFANHLLANPDLASQYGKAARATVLNKFSMKTFVKKWDELFRETASMTFKG